MEELGIAQVPQHFVTFLVAAAEAPLSSRQIQQAIARTLAYRGECSVYSALLRFCLAQGVPERAVDVWRTIQKVGASAVVPAKALPHLHLPQPQAPLQECQHPSATICLPLVVHVWEARR